MSRISHLARMVENGDDSDPVEPEMPEWGPVYQAHAPRLMRLASAVVGADEAYDLVIEAVYKAVTSSAWRGVANPEAYLVRSVVNTAASQRRSTTRRHERELRASRATVIRPVDPTNALDVRRALHHLSPQQRAIVYLVYWEDLPIAAVANWLDVGEGTVRKQLARAKNRLRESLT
jgi:RNA polymerase sigma factor (sigma-70 family)